MVRWVETSVIHGSTGVLLGHCEGKGEESISLCAVGGWTVYHSCRFTYNAIIAPNPPNPMSLL